MIKIAHLREVDSLNNNLPLEVIEVISEIASVLDDEYGVNRNINGGNGGYILFINEKEELLELIDIYIDIDTIIPEYVDKIKVNNGQDCTNTLLILGSDFTVSLIMPLTITPDRFIREYKGEGWQE